MNEQIIKKMEQVNEIVKEINETLKEREGYEDLGIWLAHNWQGDKYKIGFKIGVTYLNKRETIEYEGVNVYDRENGCYFLGELLLKIYDRYIYLLGKHDVTIHYDGFIRADFESCEKFFRNVMNFIKGTAEYVKEGYGEEITVPSIF